MSETQAGRVVALWRYPVKSMAAEPLEEIEVSWAGFAGDRRWGFVRAGLERSDFPWLTIRERPDMWLFRPRFEDESRPDDSRTLVTTPDGDELDVVDPALASELGHGARVIKQARGVFDAMPLSLITTQAISELGALAGRELEPLRFRPNLLVDAAGADGQPEQAWRGRTLRIGAMRMRVDQPDERCAVINVEPATAERDPRVLKAAGRELGSRIGVYGSVVEPGRVALGDPVVIE